MLPARTLSLVSVVADLATMNEKERGQHWAAGALVLQRTRRATCPLFREVRPTRHVLTVWDLFYIELSWLVSFVYPSKMVTRWRNAVLPFSVQL